MSDSESLPEVDDLDVALLKFSDLVKRTLHVFIDRHLRSERRNVKWMKRGKRSWRKTVKKRAFIRIPTDVKKAIEPKQKVE